MDPVRGRSSSCGSLTSHTALFPHRVMAKLYQLDDLVARLPVDRRSLKTALELSIQVDAVKCLLALHCCAFPILLFNADICGKVV